MKSAVLMLAAPVAAVLALVFGVVVVLVPNPSDDLLLSASDCLPRFPKAVDDVDLDRQQWRVANTIIDVGRELSVGPRGWVVAVTAALQESTLRPLAYGDRDSLGVFQQRDRWGSARARIDPRAAAEMFFSGGHGGQPGLLDIDGWEGMSITAAAQAVQVSAYPDAYAQWEQLAAQIVRKLADVDTSCRALGHWTSPIGSTYVLTAGFGECGSRWSECHTGQDFAVPTGTPIGAARSGVVIFAGWAGAYGNAVHVLHANGIATWYCHLSRIEVRRGDRVSMGRLIGLSGSTGNTTGPHLHFEVRTGASPTSTGTPIDPLPFLRAHDAF